MWVPQLTPNKWWRPQRFPWDSQNKLTGADKILVSGLTFSTNTKVKVQSPWSLYVRREQSCLNPSNLQLSWVAETMLVLALLLNMRRQQQLFNMEVAIHNYLFKSFEFKIKIQSPSCSVQALILRCNHQVSLGQRNTTFLFEIRQHGYRPINNTLLRIWLPSEKYRTPKFIPAGMGKRTNSQENDPLDEAAGLGPSWQWIGAEFHRRTPCWNFSSISSLNLVLWKPL